jgi:hypothetical protein
LIKRKKIISDASERGKQKGGKERESKKFFFFAIVWKKLAWNVRSKGGNDYNNSSAATIRTARKAEAGQKEIESKRRRCKRISE